jgi:hypothetical protein
MRSRPWLVASCLGALLVTGCTAQPPARAVGDRVTTEDATVLAGLLQRNHRAGGADFVVTAPYRDGVVLTLSGEVDFAEGTGRARAVTTFASGREDDERTLWFTADEVWTGELPGLAEALSGAGAGPAAHLRRDLVGIPAGDPRDPAGDGTEPLLTDVLVTVLLRLSARTADDPGSFLGGDHHWEGQRSIDSRLTTVYGLPGGRTVAVSAADDLLVQFTTPLGDGDVVATVTLADHGPRTVDLPADEESAEAVDHPDLAAAFGAGA